MRLYLALAFTLAATAAAAGPGGYALVKTLQIGGDTFWDCLTFDTAGHRLFIAHGSHVVAVDTDSYRIVGDIPDTPGVHEVALTPDRGFITAGGSDSVVTFDPATLKATGTVAVGKRPDGILYDETSDRVFTFNAGSRDSTVLDARSAAVVGTVPLGGKPEFAVSDGKGHIFDNIEDTSELIEIDTRAMRVLHRWKLAPCESPSGLAFDPVHARLFAACGNGIMAAIDAKTGAVVATVPTGKGADGAAFDPRSGDVLIPCGEGHLSVIHEDTPDRYTLVENVPTAFGARTIAFDPATRRVFTVTADLTPAPGQHPPYKMGPGSFRLLVYGR